MKVRMRTWTALVLIMALLAAGDAGNRIEHIKEIVDVSRTPINEVEVVLYHIEPELFEEINRPEVLEAVCSNIRPSFTKTCKYKIDPDERTITFYLRTVKNLIDVSGGYHPQSLSPNLKLYYVPLNFLIVDEYEAVGRRSLTFKLPTFGFTLSEITSKKDIAIDFPIQCPDGTMDCWREATLHTDRDSYEVGDTMYIQEDVEWAVWTLFNTTWGMTPLSTLYKCFHCTELTLPTSYGVGEFDCTRFEDNNCPESDILAHAIYKRKNDDHLYNASKVVRFKPSGFIVKLAAGKGSGEITDTLFLGETMVVAAVGLTPKVSRCVVKLMRGKHVLYQTKALPECSMVPIMTDTSWPEGEYIVQADISNDMGITASSTQKMFLVSPGTDIPVPVSLEKTNYIIGDTVSLYVNTPGERCVVELVNYTGTSVDTLYERAFPCGSIKFELPESIIPGLYQFRVRVYRGEEYGVHLVAFKIEEWVPKGKRGTDLDRLCIEGMLASKHVDVPCIGPDLACQPSATEYPVCMCFRQSGALLDVCKFNELCSKRGCVPRETSMPFVIINEGGEKFALTGLQKVPFVSEFEMCMTSCICSDIGGTFYDVCGPGELCVPNGCYTPHLFSKLIELAPEHVRQEQISLGKATLEATLGIRYEGKSVIEGIDPRAFTVIVDGEAIPPEDIKVERKDFNWHISAPLPKELATRLVPGEKRVWIGVHHKGETTGVQGSFTVWYATDESIYNVKIHSIEPATIAKAETQHGSFLKMYVGVTDEGGEPVKDLTRDDLAVALDGKTVNVFSMRYVPFLRQWVFTVVVRGEVSEGRRVLQLEVNKLGKAGKGAIFLSVVGERRVSIKVDDVTPGSRYNPIFQVMERIGFDMDVFVSIVGQDIIPQTSSIAMDIVDPETGEKLTSGVSPLYVSKSQTGYRIHFGGTTEQSRLQFCGEAITGWKDLVLTFLVGDEETGTAVEYTATGKLLFAPNPGEWRFIGKCKGGEEVSGTATEEE